MLVAPARTLALLLLLPAAGCGLLDGDREEPVAIPDGTFRVAFVGGIPEAERGALLAVTARVERASARLVLALGDGTEQVLAAAFRPRSRWEKGCYTMASHSLNEVADLSPAPLQLGTVNFATPLVYAYCSRSRLMLADAYGGDGPFLAFDLQ